MIFFSFFCRKSPFFARKTKKIEKKSFFFQKIA